MDPLALEMGAMKLGNVMYLAGLGATKLPWSQYPVSPGQYPAPGARSWDQKKAKRCQARANKGVKES